MRKILLLSSPLLGPSLILQTSQVVRGSARLGFVILEIHPFVASPDFSKIRKSSQIYVI